MRPLTLGTEPNGAERGLKDNHGHIRHDGRRSDWG